MTNLLLNIHFYDPLYAECWVPDGQRQNLSFLLGRSSKSRRKQWLLQWSKDGDGRYWDACGT
jgi:hypothetical protein